MKRIIENFNVDEVVEGCHNRNQAYQTAVAWAASEELRLFGKKGLTDYGFNILAAEVTRQAERKAAVNALAKAKADKEREQQMAAKREVTRKKEAARRQNAATQRKKGMRKAKAAIANIL